MKNRKQTTDNRSKLRRRRDWAGLIIGCRLSVFHFHFCRRLSVFYFSLFLLFFGSGCGRSLLNVNFWIVGEQTSLERQVLGAYGSLGEDLLLYSSVRGVNEDGTLDLPPPATESQQRALASMRNRAYNRDDVDRLLTARLVGEDRTGMLQWRGEGGEVPEGLTPDEARRIVEEENGDRERVLSRLMETAAGVGPEQKPEVERIFAGLNQELAPEGSWIEDDEGNWTRK